MALVSGYHAQYSTQTVLKMRVLSLSAFNFVFHSHAYSFFPFPHTSVICDTDRPLKLYYWMLVISNPAVLNPPRLDLTPARAPSYTILSNFENIRAPHP